MPPSDLSPSIAPSTTSSSPASDVALALLGLKVQMLERDLQDLREDAIRKDAFKPEDYVRKETFAPVRALAYGMAGAVLMGVLSAGLAFVLQKPPALPPPAASGSSGSSSGPRSS